MPSKKKKQQIQLTQEDIAERNVKRRQGDTGRDNEQTVKQQGVPSFAAIADWCASGLANV